MPGLDAEMRVAAFAWLEELSRNHGEAPNGQSSRRASRSGLSG
ncbi:MAG TPA: hypothetical protein VKY15_07685 [Acidimicrobiales bacterium]|nr:hypothetical protein [Acidimicrobiales bacterium]